MDSFENMAFHYIEIGHLLLNAYVLFSCNWLQSALTIPIVHSAKDDFKDAHIIQEKLVSIEEKRHHKIMHGFKVLSEPVPGLQLNGVSAMEINRIRDFVCVGLRKIVKVSGEEEERNAAQEDTPAASQ